MGRSEGQEICLSTDAPGETIGTVCRVISRGQKGQFLVEHLPMGKTASHTELHKSDGVLWKLGFCP